MSACWRVQSLVSVCAVACVKPPPCDRFSPNSAAATECCSTIDGRNPDRSSRAADHAMRSGSRSGGGSPVSRLRRKGQLIPLELGWATFMSELCSAAENFHRNAHIEKEWIPVELTHWSSGVPMRFCPVTNSENSALTISPMTCRSFVAHLPDSCAWRAPRSEAERRWSGPSSAVGRCGGQRHILGGSAARCRGR